MHFLSGANSSEELQVRLDGGASLPPQQPASREDVVMQPLGQEQPPGSVPCALPIWLCCPTGVPCFSSAPQVHPAEGQTALCCAVPLLPSFLPEQAQCNKLNRVQLCYIDKNKGIPGRQPVCRRAHSQKVSGLTVVSPNTKLSCLGLRAVWLCKGVLCGH